MVKLSYSANKCNVGVDECFEEKGQVGWFQVRKSISERLIRNLWGGNRRAETWNRWWEKPWEAWGRAIQAEGIVTAEVLGEEQGGDVKDWEEATWQERLKVNDKQKPAVQSIRRPGKDFHLIWDVLDNMMNISEYNLQFWKLILAAFEGIRTKGFSRGYLGRLGKSWCLFGLRYDAEGEKSFGREFEDDGLDMVCVCGGGCFAWTVWKLARGLLRWGTLEQEQVGVAIRSSSSTGWVWDAHLWHLYSPNGSMKQVIKCANVELWWEIRVKIQSWES